MKKKAAREERLGVCFPLGDFLADEMLERKLTPHDLALTTGICPERVIEILDGSRAMLSEVGHISRALGLSEVVLANLQMAYLKWRRAVSRRG